jgi:hypothetical protein
MESSRPKGGSLYRVRVTDNQPCLSEILAVLVFLIPAASVPAQTMPVATGPVQSPEYPDSPGLGLEINQDWLRQHLAKGETWWG